MTETDRPQAKNVVVDGLPISYVDVGSGPVIVFVHGVYVAGGVWDACVEALDGFRCIVPTWPLGGHSTPTNGADISAAATARRIPALLEALDLHDVTLVGNDTGGGLCLGSLGSGHSGLSRIARLVLTDCDSYEHFPPGEFAKMIRLMKRSRLLGRLILGFFASKRGRAKFLSAVCTTTPTPEREAAIFGGFTTSKQARADALAVSVTLDPAITLGAVDALKSFDRPVLLAWGDSDALFPLEHARRLEADFPNARLHVMTGSSTFVMVDRPDELAAAIGDFIADS